jgi:3-oxoacyl-[acyl-carrier protein] reductase/bacilysin biosynthesis oxidoreductase BacG
LAEQNAQARGLSVAEIKAETARNIPLGHMVDPDEIAAMTLLLVSERSRSITGIEILIDGGAAPSI